MSGLELTAVVLVALWLGVLTLVVLVLVRQVAIIDARRHLTPNIGAHSEVGPLIGARLPDEASSALGDLDGELAYLLFLSPTCGPCIEIASQLSRVTSPQPVLSLFAGLDATAEGFRALFPPTARVIRDPEASRIAQALQIPSAPFALQIESGLLTGRARLRDVDDLETFIQGYADSNAADIANWGGVVGSA